jgi:hypothetical protein
VGETILVRRRGAGVTGGRDETGETGMRIQGRVGEVEEMRRVRPKFIWRGGCDGERMGGGKHL